ncbi:MAG TPA: helix-turn-helix transcriptional regulator, partial [Planctomycetota bacterium]|nr:helix-turn-helix transcriptional regulator [Planctomycetota bacterium]
MIPDPDPVLRSALATAARDGAPPDVPEILAALAAARPASGWEMARAIEDRLPGFLDEREGCLYPVLASLVREGRLEARWVEADGAGPRRLYAPRGGIDGSVASPGSGAGASAAAAGPRLLRAAEAAARSVPDPFAREESR